MFLVVNDSSIHRFSGSRITIGSSQDCDLTLASNGGPGVQCALSRQSDGNWQVQNLSDVPILLNRRTLTSGHPTRIASSDHLRIGNHNIELRDNEGEGAVAKALRNKLFEIQVELHAKVLDVVRKNPGVVGDRDHRKTIEAELDRLLDELSLSNELEIHVASQAAQGMITDYVQGFGVKAGAQTREGDLEKNISRFASVIPRALSLIRFDEAETAAQKAERVALLCPGV